MEINIKKWMAKVTSALNPTTVSLTRTENDYVNATSFGRLKCYRFGKLGLFFINLQLTTSLPSNSTWVEIGTAPIAPTEDLSINIPCQNNNATILFTFGANKKIRIYNASGTATGTYFCRGVMPFIVGGGYCIAVFSRLSDAGFPI